ncbi:MAG: hypothetical protein RLZZ126_1869, partial [Pseudomonadota bacterium]
MSPTRPSAAPGFWSRAARQHNFTWGASLSLLLLAAAALSYVWTPWSPYDIDMSAK